MRSWDASSEGEGAVVPSRPVREEARQPKVAERRSGVSRGGLGGMPLPIAPTPLEHEICLAIWLGG